MMFVVIANVVPATQEPLGRAIKHILLYSTGPLVENSADSPLLTGVMAPHTLEN